MKSCFHVICKTCVDELVQPSKQCVLCDHEVKAGVDILELKREGSRVVLIFARLLISLTGISIGTGFAAGGLAETSKTGVSFQG